MFLGSGLGFCLASIDIQPKLIVHPAFDVQILGQVSSCSKKELHQLRLLPWLDAGALMDAPD
jgi:hypothetical protein